MYFSAIFWASMAVYVTSPEAVWALRPRGRPPPCPPELRGRLVSFGLWTPTRLIRATTGWRPVLRRGRRAGCRVCKQLTSLSVSTSPSCRDWEIPVIIGRRVSVDRQSAVSVSNGHGRMPATRRRHRRTSLNRQSVLRQVPLYRRAGQQVDTGASDVTRRQMCTPASPRHDAVDEQALSLYVVNAAALCKPHALQHLSADLNSHSIDVAIVSETHFKAKHADSVVSIPGYLLQRRDRVRRKGGGVALYVRSEHSLTAWTSSTEDRTFELLWARVNGTFFGALYHPPRPLYSPTALLDHIETCVEEITRDFPTATIVLGGDFNQLTDEDVIERTGFSQIILQPTRDTRVLDRIFVSSPIYTVVRVVSSLVKSDHKAIVAYASNNCAAPMKTRTKRAYRRVTPTHHALFLQHVSTLDISVDKHSNIQAMFDAFYTIALELLDRFYPERTITVSSRDPDFVTASIKARLRRKNRLMRAGRIEEADVLAARIGKEIKQRNKVRLNHIEGKTDVKALWTAVNQLVGRKQEATKVDGITAESLNSHYAAVSTDEEYSRPPRKHTTDAAEFIYLTELQVFRILDTLKPTATGLDGLPAWFLRTAAPVFCKPLAFLFNQSVATSTVPTQWKHAYIFPLPKVPLPREHRDFRPISITPVLTRILERTVVKHFLYPSFQAELPTLTFADQFAFRPSGSTTAALIYILHTVSQLLSTNPYVIIIALDFSKAFDTVRHHTLLQKLAMLNIPDCVYNWMVAFFEGHTHCTKLNGLTSTFLAITASVIQGSAIGPASFVVNAADLTPITPGNLLAKYADDTYLIVPASNVDSRSLELENIEKWAKGSNLTLNRSKTVEIMITDGRKKKCLASQPPPLSDISRTSNIKILGVTISNNLSVSEHITNTISKCSQTLYALTILRAHGLSDTALQSVYRSVVVARLSYACNAWWGFATSTDRQRLAGFVRRAVRRGFCLPDLLNIEDQVSDMDDKLFHCILRDKHHVLHQLLPPERTDCGYCLRPRRHDLTLTNKTRLEEQNFIFRLVYKDSY